MERQRPGTTIDSEFKRLLFYWQADPDSTDIKNRLTSLLERAAHTGRGLEIKVSDEVLGTSEGRRSISRGDLVRYSKHEGDFLVFRFKPRTGEGTVRVNFKDLWEDDKTRGIIDKYNLVLEARSPEGWRTFAVFRPHEVQSFKLR